MLYFVQQFGRDELHTREYRPKCCTFYNFEPQIWLIPPFLLHKIQHLLTFNPLVTSGQMGSPPAFFREMSPFGRALHIMVCA
nr:hypothetical protein [Paenibacillus ginsengihumi]